MTDTKISAMTSVATLTGADSVPVVQSAANKRATVAQLAAFAGGATFSPPLAALFPTMLDPATVTPTLTDTPFGLSLNGKSTISSADLHVTGFYKPVPTATTWSVIARFRPNFPSFEYMGAGLSLRESATGKLVNFQITAGAASSGAFQIEVASFNSPTSFNATFWTGRGVDADMFFRIGYDGTNYNFYLSTDLQTWFKCWSISKTYWFTSGANQVGLFVNPQNSHDGNIYTDVGLCCPFYEEI